MHSSVIPRELKIAHTAYVVAVVPAYWSRYGPGNFLWFSDLALIGLVPALWREDKRITSMLALSVVLPEILWNAGYFTRLLTRRELVGLSHYMFDRRKPLWIRGLSLFHTWLTPLLLWTLHRAGYDRHALGKQLFAGEAVLIASYVLTTPEDNVNWVYGPGEGPQNKIPRLVYLCAVMAFFPLCVWWPTHRLLKFLFRAS